MPQKTDLTINMKGFIMPGIDWPWELTNFCDASVLW